MQIIQVVPSLDLASGGPSFTVPGLSIELARSDNFVKLLTRDSPNIPDDIKFRFQSGLNLETIFLDTESSRFSIFACNPLECFLKKNTSFVNCIVHLNTIWDLDIHAVSVLARKVQVPVIVSPRGMLEPWALDHHAWKKRLAWLLYQRRDLSAANVIHATAEHEAENIRRLGFRQPIAIIPNGIDFEVFKIDKSVAKTKPKGGIRTALFLGRIHPKKGLLELVDAWAQLNPKGWRVVIAGPDEGGHRAVVEAKVAAKGLINNFEFVGSVDGADKVALYHSADLFVLPTFSENFGVVVVEALGCGLPVITTKGAPWQDLEKHHCGWWVDLGIEPLMGALYEALLSSPERLAEMGKRGRAYAENTYGWPMIAEDMLSVYKWMLGQANKPRCIV